VCMTGTPVMVMAMVMLTPKTTPGMVIIPVPLSKVPVPPNVPEPLRVGVIVVLIMPVTPVPVKVEVDVTGGNSVIVASDPENCILIGWELGSELESRRPDFAMKVPVRSASVGGVPTMIVTSALDEPAVLYLAVAVIT
jgi:hypothetical protein